MSTRSSDPHRDVRRTMTEETRKILSPLREEVEKEVVDITPEYPPGVTTELQGAFPRPRNQQS